MLTPVASLTDQINQYDALIVDLADSKYAETVVMRGVGGVGALTAVGHVLTLGDPKAIREESRCRKQALLLATDRKFHICPGGLRTNCNFG